MTRLEELKKKEKELTKLDNNRTGEYIPNNGLTPTRLIIRKIRKEIRDIQKQQRI